LQGGDGCVPFFEKCRPAAPDPDSHPPVAGTLSAANADMDTDTYAGVSKTAVNRETVVSGARGGDAVHPGSADPDACAQHGDESFVDACACVFTRPDLWNRDTVGVRSGRHPGHHCVDRSGNRVCGQPAGLRRTKTRRFGLSFIPEGVHIRRNSRFGI
jgi:hypothetical protein